VTIGPLRARVPIRPALSHPDRLDALARSPGVLKAAVRWRGILAGRPRLAEERFGWTQRAPTSSS
jgi:hypothetical protein